MSTLVEQLAVLPPELQARVLARLTVSQRLELQERWAAWAHEGQLAPGEDWRVWLIRAGRGFGKTRAGTAWVTEFARVTPDARIALVGATMDDVHRVMVEGASGLATIACSDEPVRWQPDRGRVHFASGAVAFAYSAEAPEKLQGPEHHVAWCDELAKWRYGDAAWDNLMLGLRLGENPRALVTTTPKAVNLLHRIIAQRGTIVTGGRTQDNPHLPPVFVEQVEALYRGTRLGRQELDGELIDEVEGALWSKAMLAAARIAAVPVALVRVVVGVDPPASADGDACGIVAVGKGADGVGYVLEDATVAGESPRGWAQAVAACAGRHGADRVVVEKNQGGDMVRAVLETADAALPLALVHAAKGKSKRAEPVALLYEQGQVRHAGRFAALEAELAGMLVADGYAGPGRSPDRADALVWALGELMLSKRATAGVRVVR